MFLIYTNPSDLLKSFFVLKQGQAVALSHLILASSTLGTDPLTMIGLDMISSEDMQTIPMYKLEISANKQLQVVLCPAGLHLITIPI